MSDSGGGGEPRARPFPSPRNDGDECRHEHVARSGCRRAYGVPASQTDARPRRARRRACPGPFSRTTQPESAARRAERPSRRCASTQARLLAEQAGELACMGRQHAGRGPVRPPRARRGRRASTTAGSVRFAEQPAHERTRSSSPRPSPGPIANAEARFSELVRPLARRPSPPRPAASRRPAATPPARRPRRSPRPRGTRPRRRGRRRRSSRTSRRRRAPTRRVLRVAARSGAGRAAGSPR